MKSYEEVDKSYEEPGVHVRFLHLLPINEEKKEWRIHARARRKRGCRRREREGRSERGEEGN